jgi:hypothetical protein
MIAALEQHHLFQRLGEYATAPVVMRQTVEEYIAAHHGRSSLSLETMTADQAAQFDQEMQELVEPFAQDGLLALEVVGEITWGKPQTGAS